MIFKQPRVSEIEILFKKPADHNDSHKGRKALKNVSENQRHL